jgi:hypothetical protein
MRKILMAVARAVAVLEVSKITGGHEWIYILGEK